MTLSSEELASEAKAYKALAPHHERLYAGTPMCSCGFVTYSTERLREHWQRLMEDVAFGRLVLPRVDTESVPNQPKTPLRSVRVPQDVWDAAKAKAVERGENLSEVIRKALVRYAARK